VCAYYAIKEWGSRGEFIESKKFAKSNESKEYTEFSEYAEFAKFI
jgi:hypothetical protein